MGEHRSGDRIKEETICPITFMLDGRHVCGYLVDISKSGAQFRTYDVDHDIPLKKGEEIDYTIFTNYGESECRAATMWVKRPDGDYLWGVHFTKIAEDGDDPLHRIIQSLP